jgi:hypothetical protein
MQLLQQQDARTGNRRRTLGQRPLLVSDIHCDMNVIAYKTQR